MTALFLACGCGGAGSVPTPRASSWRYDVRITPDLSAIHVRACFVGRAPARLVPVRGEPGRWTEAFDARGRELDVRDDSIELDGVAPHECVRWVTRLDQAAKRTRRVVHSGGDIVAAQSAWLWRPAQIPEGARATLRFSLPVGISVATPWSADADGTYALDRSALTLTGDVAFGRFDVQRLRVAGGDIRLARLDGRLDAGESDVRAWIGAAAEAVSSLYGRFPVERATVIVMPVGRGTDPVAFGRVGRGGGASVMLLVRRNARLETLLADWVAVHELSHLLLPLVEREDAWISEGIATYYQEILRARAGSLSPAEAFHRLDRGFARARTSGTGHTLETEADRMRHTGAHERVYYTGAAFALELDLALRELSGGRESLGSALEALHGASDRQARPWDGATVLRMLDRATGQRVCASLGERYASTREMPDAEPWFASLGLVRGPDGQLAPDGDARAARLRDRITRDPGRALAHRVDALRER